MEAFVRGCGARRSPDKIVAMACYWKRERKVKFFSRKELVVAFEEMGEPVPKNLSRDIGWAKKLNWLTGKVGEKGYYYLTRKGENVVDEGFNLVEEDTRIRKI